MKRTIVTLHLPLEMGSVGRILQVVGTFYPDATVAPGDDSASLEITADPEIPRAVIRCSKCDQEIDFHGECDFADEEGNAPLLVVRG
jgi:hypothetical protein